MPDIELTNLTAGELSPRMRGRTDVAKFWNGCESLLNFVVQPQGGATRRPGTMYVAPVGNQTSKPKAIPFVFSTVQAYVLEFGPAYFRVFRNDGQVVSGGSPVQVATPYQATDLPQLKFCQNADTLFLFHPNYAPRLVTRSSDTVWTITTAPFFDGPYLPINATSTRLSISGYGGVGASITITASSVVGINATASNSGIGFQPGDVGRCIRLLMWDLWSWATISTVTSATQATAVVGDQQPYGAEGGIDGQAWQPSTHYPVNAVVTNGTGKFYVTLAGVSAVSGGPSGTGPVIQDGNVQWGVFTFTVPTSTIYWQLGKWSDFAGWPWCGMFWQNRLMCGATNNQPSALEGSVTGNFFVFSPSEQDGSVVASNALSWIIGDDEVNAIEWLAAAGSAQAMQLALGTAGGEQIFQGASTGTALSPTSVQAYRETSLGSLPNVRPLRIGKSLLFPNRAGQKLHEWTFTWQVNGYVGPDIAVLSEHLLRAGVTNTAWQQNPLGIVWMTVAGALVGMTYLREQDVVAFHRHQLGGQYYGGAPVVEDIAVIPSADASYDELWLFVLRTVGGVVTRTVEVMRPFFQGPATEDGWFVDCGAASALTYPAGTAMVGALANTALGDQPPQWTGANGTLALSAAPAVPLASGQILRMNGGIALVTAVVTTTTAFISTMTAFNHLAPANNPDFSLTPVYSTVNGMSYLAGETIAIVADGISLGTQTAAASNSVIPPASLIVAGLPYVSEHVSQPLELLARQGQAAAGRPKRPNTAYMRFDQTVGGQAGLRVQDPDTDVITDQLDWIPSRQASAPSSAALPPFSGVRRRRLTGRTDFMGRVIVRQQEPYPLTLISVGVSLEEPA